MKTTGSRWIVVALSLVALGRVVWADEPITANGTLVLPSPIDFTASSTNLTPESAAGLDYIAAYLNAHPVITLLRIEGHFELVTTTTPLVVLTQRRALVVARALVDRHGMG